MANPYRAEGSHRSSVTGSQSGYAQAVSQARYPTGETEPHASARLREYDDEYGRSYSHSAVDDLVPVLGMFIGGAVGFLLATMIPSSQSESRGVTRAHSGYGRSTGSERTKSRSVEHDESTDLIASNKVEGTAVYNRKGERLGDVYNFMVGKRSGRVAYAVMSFGGFLGIGKRYHALPWSVLTYDTNRGGYVIDADKDRLMAAPHYAEGEDPFSRSENVRRIRDYWGSGQFAL